MRIYLLWVTVFLSASVAAPADFKAGAATADITPAMGVSMNGVISKPGPVTGVHDKLLARALVMSDGKITLGICVADSCYIQRPYFDRARKMVEAKTGIPAANLLFSSTHSHATPRIGIEDGEADRAYADFAVRRMAEALITAHGKLQAAKVAFGSFEQPGLVKIRRYLCEPGSVAANPFGESGERIKSVSGKSSKVIKPAGPKDPQFCFLSVQTAEGRPLALLGNFSVHYCGGYAKGEVSADYFGAFCRTLEARHGPDFVGLMSNGTSGDAWRLNYAGSGKMKPYQRLTEGGALLAGKVLEMKLEHTVPESLGVQFSELELGVRKPDDLRLKWARATLAPKAPKPVHPWSPTYAREALRLDGVPEREKVFLQALRIGDIAIAAVPCETFSETGLAIKTNSPFKGKTFTISLANGAHGYLPTVEQHELGGYETWEARSSHLEVEAEPKIRAAVLELLGDLKR